ncbi:MAG: alpha/beta fold hydrolase [Bacillota bacterium]|jgi:pimeloyl-ACP methyl ester carboxylesterase|nr:alpha/beta fold hydrolase [Bacillota bacterium]
MQGRLKRILALMVLIMAAMSFAVLAEGGGLDLAGTWSGALEMPGAELEMVFHISPGEDGVWLGTLDVPAQGAVGIPLSEVRVEDGVVVFDVALIAGVYSGSLGPDGVSLEGIWEQSGLKIPLTLQATQGEFAGPNRPQEPTPPYPYREVEVRYPNDEDAIELAGTLTLPEGEGRFPAVLLISGSGPQDRNEELMGHKPFLVLADYLTRRGIAVLRFDDRGVGESTGDFAAATTIDFTRDVLAGLEFLKTRPEIDPARIGLIGHSEGGLVAPMAANLSSDVAFIVLMAGPGVTGEELSYLQSDLLLRVSGAPEEVIAQQMALLRELFAIAKNVEDVDQAVEEMRNVLLAPYAHLSAEEFAALGDLETPVMAQISQLLSPWYQFFMTYDPLPALREVDCPVLAINGSLDLQVPADPNLALIEQALEEGGNQDFTVLELPGLNHLFQTAELGLPDEYYLIEETMSPVALTVMGDWLVEVTGVE